MKQFFRKTSKIIDRIKRNRHVVGVVHFIEMSVIISLLVATVFTALDTNINDVKETNHAEQTVKKLDEIRMALEKYYQLTGEYPELTKAGANDNLRILDKIDKNGKEISFAKIYGKDKLEGTNANEVLQESNLVYDISDFNKGNFRGGWNFNFSGNTGEIHANLPDNHFGQNINWIGK